MYAMAAIYVPTQVSPHGVVRSAGPAIVGVTLTVTYLNCNVSWSLQVNLSSNIGAASTTSSKRKRNVPSQGDLYPVAVRAKTTTRTRTRKSKAKNTADDREDTPSSTIAAPTGPAISFEDRETAITDAMSEIFYDVDWVSCGVYIAVRS